MHHIKDQRGAAIVNAFKGILTAKKKQIKYGLIEEMNFTIIFSKDF